MRNFPLGNRDLIRSLNRSIILNVIKNSGPIDRAQIARLTSLSPATVTGITSDLIKEELVFEKEQGDSRGGRPPILLALNPKGGYVIGIKLMEDQVVGAITDLEATLIVRDSIPLVDKTTDTAINTLTTLVQTLLKDASIPQGKLIGVGVGLAGIVDFKAGILKRSPYLGWHDFPLRDLLQEKIKAPVCIDNDVNTLTLAELWFGSGQGVDNFLVVTLGRGVGMGIVVNSHFYRGAAGGAGELGHTVMDPNGEKCECGKRGCLETIVGYPGLIRKVNQALEKAHSSSKVNNITDLVQMISSGSEVTREILKQSGAIFGLAIANLINLFNPQKIMISGEGVCLGEIFFDSMQKSIRQNTMPDLFRDVEVKVEPWGEDMWARGAASLVLRQLFESPVTKEIPAVTM